MQAVVSALLGAIFRGFTWSLFGKLLLVNLVLGALSKPKKPSFLTDARDRLHVIRSSVEPHKIVYGEAAVSGPLVYAESSGASKEYLHLVIALAGHEVESIGDIYLNEKRLGDLDANGEVTTGTFTGWVRVKKHLGTAAQAADADLVAESDGKWTANHRLRGVAYLYVRLKWDREQKVFPTGIPNILAVVRGKKLYDPRDGATRWSDNWALCVRDYLSGVYGLGCAGTEINDTLVAAAANAAEEWVAMAAYTPTVTVAHATDTLTFADVDTRIGTGDKVTYTTTGTPAGGLSNGGTYYAIRTGDTTLKLASTYANCLARTAIDITSDGAGTHSLAHVAQPRYTCNGTVNTADTPMEVLRDLLTAGVGAMVWSAGQWRLFAGVYHTPTVSLDEDDLRDALQVQAKPPRKELYNAVKGVYAEPWKLWQPTDFPVVANATYATQDGGEVITRDIELPFTTNPTRAQRIAKIHLEKSRQGITVEWPAKLSAFKVAVWDTVQISVAHLGWVDKVFRVLSWKMAENGGVDLSLQEDSSASYDWASGEATLVDPAPDTTLPSLINVAPPTGLAAVSGAGYQLVQADGITLCRLYVTWTPAADEAVTHYEIQWKLSTDIVYQASIIPFAQADAYIGPVKSGSSYHVRMRSLNAMGIGSAWDGPVTIAASSNASTFSVNYADIGGTKPPADADRTASVTGGRGINLLGAGYALPTSLNGTTHINPGSGNLTLDATTGYFGTTSIKLASTSTNHGVTFAPTATTYNIPIDPGKKWIVSAYVKGSAASQAGQFLARRSNGGANTYTTLNFTASATAGAWSRVSGVVDWTGNTDNAMLLRIDNEGGAGTTLWVDGIMVEELVGEITTPSAFDRGGDAVVTLLEAGATVKSGGITFEAGGAIKGGQTDYNTGTGWFLGYSGGYYKFSIGDPAGGYLTWDGAALGVRGDVDFVAEAGSIAELVDANTHSTTSASYVKIREFYVARSGILSLYYSIHQNSGGTGTVRVYVNGAAVGTTRTTSSPTKTYYSENITVAQGDLLQVYAHTNGTGVVLCNDFEIRTANPLHHQVLL